MTVLGGLERAIRFCSFAAVFILAFLGWLFLLMPDALVIVVFEGSGWLWILVDGVDKPVLALASWVLAYLVLEEIIVSEKKE